MVSPSSSSSSASSRSRSNSPSLSGTEDDIKKDPDYVPSTEPEDSDKDKDTDTEEEDEEQEEIPEGLLQKLTPLLMGFGSPFQMPMMLFIQGNAEGAEEDDDVDDDGDDDEDQDDAEEPGRKQPLRKRKRSLDDMAKILREYNREERTYIDKLPKEEKDRVLQAELRIRKLQNTQNTLPMRFKILDSPMDDGAKRIILAKLE